MGFSVYGHVDAARDTQWVRVAPFRLSPFVTTKDPVDAVVTLEDLDSGETITLAPALFTAGSPNFGDSLFAYNFQTDREIRPGGRYRFRALRSDGVETTTSFEIPEDRSHEMVVVGFTQRSIFSAFLDYVRFTADPGDHIALILTMRFPPIAMGNPLTPNDTCKYLTPPITRHNDLPFTHQQGLEEYQITVRKGVAAFPPPCSQGYTPIKIGIVRAREEWPWSTFVDNTHPAVAGNVANGVGFVGGVITQTVPYESCTLVGTDIPNYCELYFSPETATVIVNPVNGFPEGAIATFSPVVTLVKGDEPWRRRSLPHPEWDGASLVGRFPGLLPGEYRIYVDMGSYCERRNLNLAPGETRFIDVEMGLLLPGEALNSENCRER